MPFRKNFGFKRGASGCEWGDDRASLRRASIASGPNGAP
jgi:hypothetical protein